mgnify:CR=1 FL=1
MGKNNVLQSLITLAYDGRRSKYFRKELLSALKIIESNMVKNPKLIGSWAGAMGQCQFMPSAYLLYAQDWDGDGYKDIWANKADVFASIANYLKNEGWNPNYTWGRKVYIDNIEYKIPTFLFVRKFRFSHHSFQEPQVNFFQLDLA